MEIEHKDEEETPGDIEIGITESLENKDDSSDLDICPVCLEYQTYDSIVMECCNKLMHSECLAEWLKRRNNCPHCRTEQNSYYNSMSSSNLYNFENVERDVEIGVSRLANRLGIDIGATGFSFNINPMRLFEPSFDLDHMRPMAPRARRNIIPRRRPIRRRVDSFSNLLDAVDMGVSSINEYIAFRREIEDLDRQVENSLNDIIGFAAERAAADAGAEVGVPAASEPDAEVGVSSPAEIGVSRAVNYIHIASEELERIGRRVDFIGEMMPLLSSSHYIPLNSWFSQPSQRVVGPLFNSSIFNFEDSLERRRRRRLNESEPPGPIPVDIVFSSDDEEVPPLEDEDGNIIVDEVDMIGVSRYRYEI